MSLPFDSTFKVQEERRRTIAAALNDTRAEARCAAMQQTDLCQLLTIIWSTPYAQWDPSPPRRAERRIVLHTPVPGCLSATRLSRRERG